MAIKILEQVPLAPLTTMRVGGNARFFVRVENVEELREAVVFAKERGLPFLVLGGGSNMFISDGGLDGVVIKNEILGVKFEDEAGHARIIAGAGESWDGLVAQSIESGLYGLENLSLIPGTVGAAPVQNINAYGVNVSDTIEWVEVLDTQTMQVVRMKKEACEFKYRESVFKRNRNLIIVFVSFLLNKHGVVSAMYKDVEKYFSRKGIVAPSIADMRTAIIEIRRGKLPNPLNVGTAGSFFVHPVVLESRALYAQKLFPEISFIPTEDGYVKVISGRLLDLLGWKDYRQGNVGTYKTHALAIVNYGSNNAQEVFCLAERMRKDAKEKTGIDLEYEVRLVGKFECKEK